MAGCRTHVYRQCISPSRFPRLLRTPFGLGLIGLLALLPGACAPASAPPARVVVLVTLDTLRPDHMGCYGYIRDTSPFLDRMADEGARFTRAVAASSHTAPTHASIFTGLYPAQHRVLQNGHAFREELRPMAEHFQEAGYDTAAFTSVGFLEGLGSGFDHFESHDPTTVTAREVLAGAEVWLEERQATVTDEPLFLWIHLYDAHMPFLANDTAYAQELRDELKVSGEAYSAYLQEELGVPVAFFADPSVPEGERLQESAKQMVHTHTAYDAEIRFMDGQLEGLYGLMDSLGLNQDALWVFVADHGEGLGNHNLLNHDLHLYQEQLEIPLILHETTGRIPPLVIDDLVRQVDLLPTVLQLVQIPYEPPAKSPGRSLVGLLRGGNTRPIPHAFSQRRAPFKGWSESVVYTLQTKRYKYIYHEEEDDEFYNLELDPLETTNLAETDRPEIQRVRRMLQTLVESWSEENAIEPVVDSDGHLEELSALGYIGD